MKRIAGTLLALALLSLVSYAQTTTITATNEKMAGAKISGTVTMTPVNANNVAIPFADATGSQNGPTAYQCALVNGAVGGMLQPDGTYSGTCTVPDSTMTIPANIRYLFQIMDTSVGHTTSGKSFSFVAAGVSGATWALDHYGPPSATSNVQAVQASQGPATPTSCVSPSVFTNTTTLAFYTCVNGVPVQVGGSSSGTTPSFAIGTITTGAAGTSATATLTGTPPAYVLNLTIPAGAAGSTGTTGATGTTPTFSIGTVTALSAGATPTVTLGGTPPAYVLNFGFPSGGTGTVSASSIQTALATLSSCTAHAPYVPFSGVCEPAPAYSAIRSTSSATDTISVADCGLTPGYVLYNNTGSTAVTLPVTGLTPGCRVVFKALGGSGSSLVITPSSGTIDGVAALPTIYYPGDGGLTWTGTTWTAQGGYGVRGAGTLTTPYGLPYVSTPGSVGQVAPNTSTTKKYLSMTGSGSAGAPLVWDSPFPIGSPLSNGDLYVPGDSTLAVATGVGATDFSKTASSILAADKLGQYNPIAQGGQFMDAIADQLYRYFVPAQFTSNEVPVVVGNGGVNDANTTGATTGALNNYSLELNSEIAWVTIPPANYQPSTSSVTAGTWVTQSGQCPTLNGSTAFNQIQSSVSGSTQTYTITSNGKIGVRYCAPPSGGGAFTVGIGSSGGTLQTDGPSATTTFTAGGNNGQAVGTATMMRQEFTAATGTQIVTITTTSNAPVSIVSVDTNPATLAASQATGLFVMSGVLRQQNDANSAATAAFDTAAAAVVAQALADRQAAVFANVRTGNPGVNTTTDMAQNAITGPCAGGSTPLHPNNCGYQDYANTIENAVTAAGYNVFFKNINASRFGVSLNSSFVGPVQVQNQSQQLGLAGFSNTNGTNGGSGNQFGPVVASATVTSPGQCYFNANNHYGCSAFGYSAKLANLANVLISDYGTSIMKCASPFVNYSGCIESLVADTVGNVSVLKSLTTPSLLTATNCASAASPAVCAAAPAGAVVVAAGATSVVVNTTIITANSQVIPIFDSSLGTRLGVTCNTTASLPTVSARTAGTSFTLTTTAPTTNPACFSYTITN